MSMDFSKHPHDRILICNFYLYLATPETLPSRSSQAKSGSQYFYFYLSTLFITLLSRSSLAKPCIFLPFT